MRWRRQDPVKAERERLLTPRPGFRVHFSADQVAAALWDHGEDELADRALMISVEDLAAVQAIAAWLEDPTYPVPVTGLRVTHRHVMALAAITHVEGGLRPLASPRRRPTKNRPARFVETPPDPAAGL